MIILLIMISLFDKNKVELQKEKKEQKFIKEVFTVNANLKTNIAKELLSEM